MTAVIEDPGEAGWVLLHTPYNEDFVASLKSRIPGYGRRWNRDRRGWLVQESFAFIAISLCQQYFDEVHDRRGVGQASAGSVSSAPYAALHLLPTAPQEVVKAAYRALTLIHHPDRGGTHERMVAINVAVQAIYRLRGWK